MLVFWARELTIDVVVDFSSIMQQPEFLPAQHPARFSVCQLMAERHGQTERTRGRQTLPSSDGRAHWSFASTSWCLRDEVGVVAQRVFQFLQESEVTGFAGSQTLLVLQTAAALTDWRENNRQTPTLKTLYTPEWRWCLCASLQSGHRWFCCQSTSLSPTVNQMKEMCF